MPEFATVNDAVRAMAYFHEYETVPPGGDHTRALEQARAAEATLDHAWAVRERVQKARAGQICCEMDGSPVPDSEVELLCAMLGEEGD